MAYSTNGAVISLFTVTDGTANNWTVDIDGVGVFISGTVGTSDLVWARAITSAVSRPLGGAEVSIPAGMFDIDLPFNASYDTTDAGIRECLEGLLINKYIGLLTQNQVGSNAATTSTDAKTWNEISTAVGASYRRVQITTSNITIATGALPT